MFTKVLRKSHFFFFTLYSVYVKDFYYVDDIYEIVSDFSRTPYVVLVIKPGSATCIARTVPLVLRSQIFMKLHNLP